MLEGAVEYHPKSATKPEDFITPADPQKFERDPQPGFLRLFVIPDERALKRLPPKAASLVTAKIRGSQKGLLVGDFEAKDLKDAIIDKPANRAYMGWDIFNRTRLMPNSDSPDQRDIENLTFVQNYPDPKLEDSEREFSDPDSEKLEEILHFIKSEVLLNIANVSHSSKPNNEKFMEFGTHVAEFKEKLDEINNFKDHVKDVHSEEIKDMHDIYMKVFKYWAKLSQET